MPWENVPRSKRSETLPPNWKALVEQVRARCGNRCEVLMKDGRRCRDPMKAADHIIAHSQGGTDDESNLQGICEWHHARKTAKEGANARKPSYEARRRALYRKPETPPAHIDKKDAVPRPRRGF